MAFTITKVTWSNQVPDTAKFCAYLISDNWDDFHFKTSFVLVVFDQNGVKYDLGPVKIGYFGQKPAERTQVPGTFTELPNDHFSLGQGTNYYETVQTFDRTLRDALLSSLNDIVFDEDLLTRALEEEVTGVSLLRGVSVVSVKGQFRRLLQGFAKRTEYHFKYTIPQRTRLAGFTVDFHVNPKSNPPTNVHVLIGRNGVGKTHLLNNMVNSLVENEEGETSLGEFTDISGDVESVVNRNELFAGVVSVSFSAFDPFMPRAEKKDKTEGMRYSYVGLKRTTNRGGERGNPMSHDMLVKEFVESMMRCFVPGKIKIWKQALRTLESDPLFKEAGMSELAELDDDDNEIEKKAKSLFKKMSSGHQIVLLTITRLVENVEEKTLILVDEPEGHLHPPLLSAFVRALSDLLSRRNGVAIIATHSPVVLQEVPKSCVWKLRRAGLSANAERPEIETFGENVGILTREFFGLEVTESGYHQLLTKALEEYESYETILSSFCEQLGSEARGILRGLLAD